MPAEEQLQRAFRERADGVTPDGTMLIGLFGDGTPYPLIQAAGGTCVDVKAPPLSDAENGPVVDVINEITESFLDEYTTRFLHRFAAGAFDHYAMILFARDDVAGLAAYQYAAELRRQDMVRGNGPILHIWNLLHSDSDAAHRYNLTELDSLIRVFADLGLELDDDALKASLSLEVERREAVERVGCTGAERFIYRAAGRWLPAQVHLSALKSLKMAPQSRGETRIGLVGTASDSVALREICSALGTLEADLMPFGDVWSYDTSDVSDAESLIRAIAKNPLNVRVNPASRYGAAIQERIINCDLVLSGVNENDDSFGWEVPSIRAHILDRRARFLDLGFVPFRPSENWITQTKQLVLEALQ